MYYYDYVSTAGTNTITVERVQLGKALTSSEMFTSFAKVSHLRLPEKGFIHPFVTEIDRNSFTHHTYKCFIGSDENVTSGSDKFI